jgi:hypothetical protein
MSYNVHDDDPLVFNPDTEQDIDFFKNNLKNNNEKLPSFLEFYSSFPTAGKQGILGLLKDHQRNRKYVYKISQYLNFIVNQEYNVMEDLNNLRDYCPHFCKSLGKFRTKISKNFRKEDNPFEIRKKYIMADVLLMEHLEETRKLYRYIKNKDIPVEALLSLVKQTLISNIIASENVRFTHYDMHSNNVLVKKCPTNSVFLYILDENRTYAVPTYGYYPIVIDFGFSFSNNCNDKPLYGALAHTNIGFIPSVHDQHADPKLFLTSVSYELKKYKKCEKTKNFRDLILNIYEKCDIDFECGWDNREESPSVSDYILKKMNNQFKRSSFFKNQGHHVVDMLQTLVELPLSNRRTSDDLEELSSVLVTEFYKIEREISNEFNNLYILKGIIESCIRNKSDYLDKERRADAVNNFKKDVLNRIDQIVDFCNPKINWERLLCCLLCLSKCIENVCYEKVKSLTSLKRSDYNKMRLKNTSEIYESIEANMPSHFYFDEDTTIYVWNIMKKYSYKTTLKDSEFIKELNKIHPFERGTMIYEHLSNIDDS